MDRAKAGLDSWGPYLWSACSWSVLAEGTCNRQAGDPWLKTRKLAAELVPCTLPPLVNGEEAQEACLEGMSSRLHLLCRSVAKSTGSFTGKSPPQLIRVRKAGRMAVCGMLGTVGGPFPLAVCPVHPIRRLNCHLVSLSRATRPSLHLSRRTLAGILGHRQLPGKTTDLR